MHIEAHFAVGWALAHLGGWENRRFRALVVAASILPDVDAISRLFGSDAFFYLHHKLGHNLYFSILVSLISTGICGGGVGRRLKVAIFTQLAFYLHYFGDYYYSGWELYYYWPTSRRNFAPLISYPLEHPINMAFGYISYALIIVMAFLFKRTPLELISPKLDHLVINLFRKKPLQCHICGRPANEHCDICNLPCCPRHAHLTWRFDLICKAEHAESIKT